MSLTFTTLRSKHPAIRFQGFSIDRSGDDVTATFTITLEPNIQFQPTLSFRAVGADNAFLAPYLFSIGMVELLSYWKAACPKKIIIECGTLSEEQTLWWHDLFIHGLGEFYFTNNINPSVPDLLTIESQGPAITARSSTQCRASLDGDLVLAAGGKDSSLALEMLKTFDPSKHREVMILNPTRSALESVAIAGYREPVIIRRTIDRQLLALNANGYLNGHTPFSAYLAFLGTMVADIHNLGAVVVSNEHSASEENALFHGLPVNHQYSKGIRFERRFRDYATKEFPGAPSYYSLIRPIYDIQVSKLFARLAPSHLKSFRSCNVGQKEDRWCGRCPKCAFVCLTIAPFITTEIRYEIFGHDLFEVPSIISAVRELTGLQAHKPLECVGTIAESRVALVLTLEHYKTDGKTPPLGLVETAATLAAQDLLPSTTEVKATLTAWSAEHHLPPAYARALRQLVQEPAE